MKNFKTTASAKISRFIYRGAYRPRLSAEPEMSNNPKSELDRQGDQVKDLRQGLNRQNLLNHGDSEPKTRENAIKTIQGVLEDAGNHLTELLNKKTLKSFYDLNAYIHDFGESIRALKGLKSNRPDQELIRKAEKEIAIMIEIRNEIDTRKLEK